MQTKANIIYAAVACVLFMQNTQAVSPPPDGGYPRGNTAEGQSALFGLTSGGYNTAVGYLSLRADATGSFNTAMGAGSLLFNTASNNTAFGAAALLFNTNGSDNTAVGAGALLNNVAFNNTAIGSNALSSNTTGSANTADGFLALFSNTEGGQNTAIGFEALFSNTTGTFNTAIGEEALFSNTDGIDNTAIGAAALRNNTEGVNNTAVGLAALSQITSGNGNIALGKSAGSAFTTGSNNIHIGHPGDAAGDSDTIRIGQMQTRAFVAGIFGQTPAGAAIPVLIDQASQLGTQSSSRRFKTDIQPLDKDSEAVFALKPVRFHYKSDNRGTKQFGLIAEEVAEVNPDLVVRDKKGQIYTVRYDAVNAMLLNEFLKEHRKVEEQQAMITQLTKQIETIVAHSKEQDAQIQTVSAKVETRKAPPQVVSK